MVKPRVLIVGGGFGGLAAARGLRKAPVEVLLIDRTNHHLFQPLLYQVATAGLSPADIARPLRDVLRRQHNATVLMGEVVAVDREADCVELETGARIEFDYLVIAVGARHAYFGHPDWEQCAPGLKTLADALEIRSRLLTSFEVAERAAACSQDDQAPHFVVVGGGPTGVEMAGAIAEIAHQTMKRNFRLIDPANTRVELVEAGPRLLPSFPPELGRRAQVHLKELGVEVRVDTRITEIQEADVELQLSDGVSSRISGANVVWAAGNQVSPLVASLGAECDASGRAMVNDDLTVGAANIFVIGDAAHSRGADGLPLPGVAPLAKQQGAFVAEVIRADIAQRARPHFVYRDRGTMATIGKARAVAWMGRLCFGGIAAWLAWSLVHILFLIGFRNRAAVMLEWIYLYLTGRRGSRLLYDSARLSSRARGSR